ncbi:MAG: class I SAM-dependent methyltransferase [Bacteriovoracaceae bacterium]
MTQFIAGIINFIDLIRDLYFDKKLKVETLKQIEVYDLNPRIDKDIDHLKKYQPTRNRVFAKAINFLPRNVELSKFQFCDIGSGKGRCLIQAAHFPFIRIWGIEVCKNLTETSKKNLKSLGLEEKIEVLNSDAREVLYPKTPTIFFLFNPFGSKILKEWLEKILRDSHHLIIIIYVNPIYEYVIEMNPHFEKLHEIKSVNSNNRISYFKRSTVGNGSKP